MAEGRRDYVYLPPRDSGNPGSLPQTPAVPDFGDSGDGARSRDFVAYGTDGDDLAHHSVLLDREIRHLQKKINTLSAKRSHKVRSDIRHALSSPSHDYDSDEIVISRNKPDVPPDRQRPPRTSDSGGRMDSGGQRDPVESSEFVASDQSQRGDVFIASCGNVKPTSVSGSAGEVVIGGGECIATMAGSPSLASAKVEDSSGGVAAGDGQGKNKTSAGGRVKRKQLVLEKFDGSNISLETYLAKFRNCSRFNDWTSEERVAFLRDSLSGNASQILWEVSDDADDQEIIRLLKMRFGNTNQMERFRAELRGRRRRKGESVQSVYQDMRRLMSLAFPCQSGELFEIIGRDAFLES